jgi:hypothetical protein
VIITEPSADAPRLTNMLVQAVASLKTAATKTIAVSRKIQFFTVLLRGDIKNRVKDSIKSFEPRVYAIFPTNLEKQRNSPIVYIVIT